MEEPFWKVMKYFCVAGFIHFAVSCAIGYSDRALNDAIRLCKEQPVLGSFTEAHYKEKRCIQEAKRKHRRTTQG